MSGEPAKVQSTATCDGLHGAFFDAEYYCAQLPVNPNDPWMHFLDCGDRDGLDPSPYFSTQFYKERYPDWREDAPTALQSFILHEMARTHRQPHPLIVPEEYMQAYPDIAEHNARPNLHFATLGDMEGRSPSFGFDAPFYARCYLELGQSRAFQHYMFSGIGKGFLPKPSPKGAGRSAAAGRLAIRGRHQPIVLAVHEARHSGVPILTLDLARALAGKGLDPVFIAQNGGPLVEDFEKLGKVFVLSEGWELSSILAGIGCTVPVIVNTGAAEEIARQAALDGHRTLLFLHEMPAWLEEQSILAGIIEAGRLGAQILTSFPVIADALRDNIEAVAVIAPGVLPPHFSAGDWRKRREQLKRHINFIGAGHGGWRKGFDLFVEAAWRISYREPDARFIWLGTLDPWAQSLADAALADGLRLDLPGFVNDSGAWYAQAAAYLLTSRQDPGPTTAIHAAATGTPFVAYATDIGMRGVADVVGHFVEAGDVDGFVNAALDFAAHDHPQDRRRRRALVREMASFDVWVDQIFTRATSVTQ